MKLSAILEPLIAAGVPGDVLLATVRAYEDQAELVADEGKEKARERWRRWKNKQGTNVGKRLQTDTNVSKPLAHVEDNLQSKKISGQEEKIDASPAARPQRGQRIPDDFEPDTTWAQAQGLSSSEARHEAAQFIDFWRAKPGKDGLKLDWPGTWRVWVRNNLKRQQSNVHRQAASPPRRKRNFADVAMDRWSNGNGSEGVFGGD